ncbi:hypothetical protein OSL04_13950, partial [Escherichia coli]|nr:hypothetical protein [Escherichia coli]
MKTLICQQPGVMEYVEKDIPTPADNEVLLKIKAVGIGNDSNLLIVFYVQIMPDDFVMQLHR